MWWVFHNIIHVHVIIMLTSVFAIGKYCKAGNFHQEKKILNSCPGHHLPACHWWNFCNARFLTLINYWQIFLSTKNFWLYIPGYHFPISIIHFYYDCEFLMDAIDWEYHEEWPGREVPGMYEDNDQLSLADGEDISKHVQSKTTDCLSRNSPEEFTIHW